MTALKLLVAPALVFLATHVIFGLPPLWVAVATLYAALPTGANVYLFAQRYGVYVARSTSVVLVATALSVFSLTALLAIFAQ
jgi:predicted permease